MKTYRNFYVHVSGIDSETGEYQVRVGVGSPGGLPGFDEKETRAFDANVFNLESGANLLEQVKFRSINTSQLFRLGAILSDLLLPGEVRLRLLRGLEAVREGGQGLRLRLIIEADALAILPWEYLYVEGSGAEGQSELNFMALQLDVSIVRHGAIDRREPRLEKREQYKLVVAMAAPALQPAINVGKDREAIEKMIAALKKVKRIGAIEPVWVERATSATLFDAMRDGADIFHFAGHGYFDGEAGQIILDKGDGKNFEYYPAKSLAQLLTSGVKLAVLGACESGETSGENIWGGVAPALVQAGLAAVVASQYRLEDRNAAPLTREVYRGVLGGDTVDEAVSNARRAIRNQSGLENRDWGALVLYLRVEDGVIFPQQVADTDTLSIVPRIAPTPLQSPLIGRDDEMAKVQQNLRGGKYYFYGAYGVGKTSLVTELFNRAVKNQAFDDGYIWHRVSQGTDANYVLEWIGAQFGDQTVAKAIGPTAKINALRELLSEREGLLIGLDEVADARLAQAVLEAAGNCTIVLNGLLPLGLGVQSKEFELPPLSPNLAEQLFASLIHRPLEGMTDADRQEIKSVCALMGYLPLAIKLAALKNAEGESLSTIRKRLEVAPETIIKGHEEVSAIFATIYDDLQSVPTALRLLIRLASFPALEAPLDPLREGEDDLDFFQAKDKVIALGVVSPAGADRLAVHPLLGRMAKARADRAAVAAEKKSVGRWLLSYAHEHGRDYQALEREQRNLLGAFNWFDAAERPEGTIDLMRHLFNYLRVRGYWQEASERLNQALKFARDLGRTSDQAWLLLSRGIILSSQGDDHAAEADYREADAIYQQEQNQTGRGQVLYHLAKLSFTQGKLAQAREQVEQALKDMDESTPASDRAGAHARLAGILATQGELDRAREQYGEALKLSIEEDDLEEQARVRSALGRLLRKAGKHAEALTEYQLASEQYEKIGHVRDIAFLELEIGYHHYYQGRYDQALEHFQKALETFQTLKYKLGVALSYHAQGNVAYSRNELDEAEKKYRLALAINQNELDARLGVARNQYQLAAIMQRRGQLQEAEAAYREVDKIATEGGDLALRAGAIHQLGRLALSAGEVERARTNAMLALDLAKKAEDRLTEVSALSLLGLARAQGGDLTGAKEDLIAALSAFKDLNAPEVQIVTQLLKELEARLDSSSSADNPSEPGAPSGATEEGAPFISVEGNIETIVGVNVEGAGTAAAAEAVVEDYERESPAGSPDVTVEGMGIAGDPEPPGEGGMGGSGGSGGGGGWV